MVAEVGPAAVAEAAADAGIDADLDAVPAIALGVEEVSPLDLASAYLTFADDGTAVEPYAITRIEDGDGNVLWEPDRPAPEAGAVDQDVARAVHYALQGGIDGGNGSAAGLGRPARSEGQTYELP